jgi:hypothetical protein
MYIYIYIYICIYIYMYPRSVSYCIHRDYTRYRRIILDIEIMLDLEILDVHLYREIILHIDVHLYREIILHIEINTHTNTHTHTNPHTHTHTHHIITPMSHHPITSSGEAGQQRLLYPRPRTR